MQRFKNPEARPLRVLARAFVASLVLVLSTLPAVAKAQDAKTVVRGALDRVLAALVDPKLDEDQRYAKVTQIAYANFDFETMSKLVLARDWKRFDKGQQIEFVKEFKDLLSRTYGERLSRYGDVKVALTGEQSHKRGDVTVDTEITAGEFKGVQIDYRMRPEAETWKVIDVKIEGISLVSSYRTQFRDALANSTPDKLLQRMRDKNLGASGPAVASPSQS